MPPSGQTERDGWEDRFLSPPCPPRPPGHPKHAQGCKLSRLGCGPGPSQCWWEVFTLGPPLLHTRSPTPVPWGVPDPQKAQRRSHVPGLASLGEWEACLTFPVPFPTPHLLICHQTARPRVLSPGELLSTLGEQIAVRLGGLWGGVTCSSAVISPDPVSPKAEAPRARPAHQRPLDEPDAALVCRG